MELDYAILAHNATTVDGSLHLFAGGIDRIETAGFPAIGPPLALAIRFRVKPSDLESEHFLSLRIEGPTSVVGGAERQKIETKPNQLNPADESGAVIIAHLPIVFDRAGAYRVKILLDDVEVRSLPIYVVGPEPGQSGDLISNEMTEVTG